jgi:hypothetical protein
VNLSGRQAGKHTDTRNGENTAFVTPIDECEAIFHIFGADQTDAPDPPPRRQNERSSLRVGRIFFKQNVLFFWMRGMIYLARRLLFSSPFA